MRKLILLLILCTAADLGGGPAMFRGDPRHTGVYGPVSGRNLVGMQWRFPTGGEVDGSPTVDGNTVYVGSGDGKLYAIDLWSGSQKWSYDTGSPISATPAIDATTIYIANRRGDLLAIDKSNHKIRWQHPSGPDVPWPWGHESYDNYTSSAVLSADIVIFGAGDGNVYAFDATSGKSKWTARTGERIRSTPAVADGAVFVGTAGGKLYRFDLASGQREWIYTTTGASYDSGEFGYDRRTIQSSPAIAKGVVYVGSRDGKFYAVDAKMGALRWKTDYDLPWVITSPAVADGRVYIGSSDGLFVQSLNADDGKENWKTVIGARVWSSPAVAGDLIFAGDTDGHLDAFDRASGARLWSFTTGSEVLSSPALAHDLVVFGSGDGAIYALRVGSTSSQRAFFAPQAKPDDDAVKFFADRGYATIVDANAFATFLTERSADRAPSVVIVASNRLPDAARPMLRRYLDSGGKIVWAGVPPGIIPNDPTAMQRLGPKAIDYGAPETLLGVSHAVTGSDPRGAHATAAGQKWGLEGRWRSGWGVPIENVTVPLSIDEWGFTTEWVKTFGGPPGTGFVRARGGDRNAFYWMAEYRPSPQPVEHVAP
jgi:outer membrane protein assembly factor BamB